MRPALRRSVLLSLLLPLSACGQADDAAEQAEASREAELQLSVEDVDRVFDLGSAVAGRLAGTLIQNLTAAMNEGGPAAAIDFCSTQAIPITEQVSAAPPGFEVKRTSSRIRNPANRPDSLEALALVWFEAQIAATDSVPPLWVQPAGEGHARFYRPLVANEMCMQCHGAVEDLLPEVVAALAERYPTDEATGYAPGDLRGLIRVTVPLDGRAP